MITKIFKLTIATDTEEQMRKEEEHLSMIYGAEDIIRGKWEYTQYDANQSIGNWHCSECRNIVVIIGERHIAPDYKYCPWCGAEMEEENADSN